MHPFRYLATRMGAVVYNPEGHREGPSGGYDLLSAASMFDKLSDPKDPETTDASVPSDDPEPTAAEGADEPAENELDETLSEEDAELAELEELENPKPTEKTETKPVVSDDTEVEITVDGQVVKAPIKELKRLYGQEASLTRKSMETAELRRASEERTSRAQALIDLAVGKAESRWKKYENIDFIAESHRMSPEGFQELRREAMEAWTDYEALKSEHTGFTEAQKAEAHKALMEQAKAAITELSDPVKGIPGWGPDLYNNIRSYGVKQGIPQETVDTIVDPVVIKTLHKAMLYDALKEKATARLKAKTPTAPKKVQQSNANAPSNDDPNVSRRETLMKLRQAGGKLDAAAAAFDSLG